MIEDFHALPKLPKLDARIAAWKLQTLSRRPCPLCHNTNASLLRRPDGLPLSFCPQCALWYVCGIPSEEEIHALYQGYWFNYRPKQLDDEGARRLLKQAANTLRLDLRIQRLTALLGTFKNKLILEVGAGAGEFLLAARQAGAEVIGNDISAESCEFLSAVLGIAVIPGELTENSWQSRPPDLIVMNDLIEHPIRPLELLHRAIALLEKGGRLLIWTPNGGGAGEDSATAASWVGFRVDLEHLQYFSPRTIQILAGRLGLSIDHLETTGYPALAGIEDRPSEKIGYVSAIARGLKKFARERTPWVRMCLHSVRELRRPRTHGNYHLFAILRKI